MLNGTMLERLSTHMLTPLIQASCALLVLVLLRRLHTWAWGSSPTRLPLPPGPRGLPIVGNIRDVPSMPTWVTYKKWSDTYGRETFSVKFPMLISNTTCRFACSQPQNLWAHHRRSQYSSSCDGSPRKTICNILGPVSVTGHRC